MFQRICGIATLMLIERRLYLYVKTAHCIFSGVNQALFKTVTNKFDSMQGRPDVTTPMSTMKMIYVPHYWNIRRLLTRDKELLL